MIIRFARALKVDFVGPPIITAIVSNSAGMLTLVGDPATFVVGSAIGMTFGEYLQKASLGGPIAVLAIIPLLPRLLPEVWQTRIALRPTGPAPRIERPAFVVLALAALAVMVLLFLFWEALPSRIGPPVVAIIWATLALLVIDRARVEPVDKVLLAAPLKRPALGLEPLLERQPGLRLNRHGWSPAWGWALTGL